MTDPLEPLVAVIVVTVAAATKLISPIPSCWSMYACTVATTPPLSGAVPGAPAIVTRRRPGYVASGATATRTTPAPAAFAHVSCRSTGSASGSGHSAKQRDISWAFVSLATPGVEIAVPGAVKL